MQDVACSRSEFSSDSYIEKPEQEHPNQPEHGRIMGQKIKDIVPIAVCILEMLLVTKIAYYERLILKNQSSIHLNYKIT